MQKRTSDDLHKYSGDNFTEEERQFLRLMMERERHFAWFWATMRQWAFWTAATVTGIVTLREQLKALFTWLFR